VIPRIALGSAIAILLATTSGPLSAQPGPAPGKLSVGFDSEGAVVEGITPGGNVAWLGASRSHEEWGEHLAHWRLLTADDDKDRIVRFPREKGFPEMTILAAIDLTTGTWAVGATYPLEGEVPGPDLGQPRHDSSGLVDSISVPASRVDLLVVRPGADAWSARILDGSPLDLDAATDGVVTVGLAALPSRTAKATRLDGIRPGDIVAMTDARGPWVHVARITAAGGKE